VVWVHICLIEFRTEITSEPPCLCVLDLPLEKSFDESLKELAALEAAVIIKVGMVEGESGPNRTGFELNLILLL
jgi:hypothetical protein